MTTNVFFRRRAERFAQLLDEANGGPRHHARARVDEQLAELVAVGHQLSSAPPRVDVDPDFRTGLRAMLIATAEREGIGHAAEPAESEPPRRFAPASHARGPRVAARRLRARGAIVVGVAAGAMAISGMSAASENAVPGDTLYGVKRSTERAQLALASSDVTRGQLFLDFARNRLAEAGTVPGDSTGLPAVFTDMDGDTREGVKLLNTSAVQRRDAAGLRAVDSFVVTQRRQLGQLTERLNPTNQARAQESLTLLDDVERRVRGLRDALPCGADGMTSDSLGPQPRTCWSAPGTAASEGEPQGDPTSATTTTDRNGPQPVRTERTGGPAGSPGMDAGQPSGAPASSAPDTTAGTTPTRRTPTPTPTPTPTGDDGMLGDIGRLFGGILG